MAEQLPRRKLRVASTEVLGNTKKGGKIYKVNAVNEDGAPVEEELRAFEELPLGELVEYALKKYEHPKYGVSWTLYPPKNGGSSKTSQLATKVADLEKRVDDLERALRLRDSQEVVQAGKQFGDEPDF